MIENRPAKTKLIRIIVRQLDKRITAIPVYQLFSFVNVDGRAVELDGPVIKSRWRLSCVKGNDHQRTRCRGVR